MEMKRKTESTNNYHHDTDGCMTCHLLVVLGPQDKELVKEKKEKRCKSHSHTTPEQYSLTRAKNTLKIH